MLWPGQHGLLRETVPLEDEAAEPAPRGFHRFPTWM